MHIFGSRLLISIQIRGVYAYIKGLFAKIRAGFRIRCRLALAGGQVRCPAAKLPTLISAKTLAQMLPFWSKEGKIHSSVIESEAQDRGGIAESGGRAGMPAAAGIAAKSNGVKHHLGVENADRVCMHTRPNTAGSFVYLSLTHTSSSSDPCSVQSLFCSVRQKQFFSGG